LLRINPGTDFPSSSRQVPDLAGEACSPGSARSEA